MDRPIGDFSAEVHDKKLTRLAVRALGVIDLHTHSRLRPLFEYFSKEPTDRPLSVLEVGCGDGMNLFELHRRRPIRGVGYDLSPDAIRQAQRVNAASFDSAIEFHCQGVEEIKDTGSYDCILCMDILEHLNEPTKLLCELDRLLKPGGCFVVSVPTTRYPIVFGERFNREIGHVMNGYTLPTLDGTLPRNYERVSQAYSTGRVASIGCSLYYKHVMGISIRKLRIALHIMLVALFKWIDPLNNSTSSCSLFAVYRKA